MTFLGRTVALLLGGSMFLSQVPPANGQPRAPSMAGRSTMYAPRGAIATSHPLATTAGLTVLERGGNAIDAAVTAAAVLNVVEPMMTGAGGDLFALYWLAKEKRLVGLNGSGRSGSLISRDLLLKRGHKAMPTSGAESITVPGALAAWQDLLAAHGTITLADALAPAIRLAEEGFPLTPIIAGDWASTGEVLEKDEGGRATYLIDGTRYPKTGEWIRNPDLAATFRLIANEGVAAFYGGSLGAKVARRIQELGGFVTVDDLAAHRSDWVVPISVPFKGYRLYELPPNGQGIAALEMLRILEPYDLKGMGHNTASYLHHLIEAKKLAFADLERFVGDPTAMTTPAEHLLSDAFIAERRSRLNARRATERAEPGPALTSSETIYLTAADQFGNMVSFINSLAGGFGSGVVVPGTGLALQNRGAGFTLTDGLPNTVAPRKRPFHTIIPAFVTKTAADGREEPWMSYGVMGGGMQPQGHVQVLLNLLVFGMDLQEAVDAARFRHSSGYKVALEPPIGEFVRAELTAMGHEVSDLPASSAGGAQAIVKLAKGYAAGSDPRKDGMAAGH
ncbi:MAG: gamma-glutamyltransferase [Gemmatimonadales bacterium]